MNAKPILFSAPMIRALQEGRKTQTRRIMKLQPTRTPTLVRLERKVEPELVAMWATDYRGNAVCVCPYGRPGDLLWVRETWAPNKVIPVEHRDPGEFIYAADLDVDRRMKWAATWKPSIHMPRKASRLTLRITDVRVERLREISEADAQAEGCDPATPYPYQYRDSFAALWDSINGPGAWDENPSVWGLSFQVFNINVDAFAVAVGTAS